MTDVVNGSSQGTDIPSSMPSPQEQQSAPSAPHSAPEERSFRQSEVNEIVKRAKNDAVESYRRINAEQPEYAKQKYGTVNSSEAVHQGNFDELTYRKIASEEAKRHLEEVRQDALRMSQEESAKRTVQNFFAKTGKGREKYQDFDQVTGDVDLGRFPNVIHLLGEVVENSDDVFYELAKDRTKMAMLEQLVNMSPNDAIVQVKRMSKSIQDNQAALKIRHPNEPLSQLRPSNTGTDTGALSVSDYRKKYRV
jgi:hypothetical protein